MEDCYTSFLKMAGVPIVLIMIVAAIIVSDIVACAKDREVGIYEYSCCGERFVLAIKEFIFYFIF